VPLVVLLGEDVQLALLPGLHTTRRSKEGVWQ
jgi:hypothetical protein